jgi:hypothetical protein
LITKQLKGRKEMKKFGLTMNEFVWQNITTCGAKAWEEYQPMREGLEVVKVGECKTDPFGNIWKRTKMNEWIILSSC